jgi:hypothetical protein
MDFKKVQDLIKYFESSKLTTMAIEDGPFKLSLSKLKEAQPSEMKLAPVPDFNRSEIVVVSIAAANTANALFLSTIAMFKLQTAAYARS